MSNEKNEENAFNTLWNDYKKKEEQFNSLIKQFKEGKECVPNLAQLNDELMRLGDVMMKHIILHIGEKPDYNTRAKEILKNIEFRRDDLKELYRKGKRKKLLFLLMGSRDKQEVEKFLLEDKDEKDLIGYINYLNKRIKGILSFMDGLTIEKAKELIEKVNENKAEQRN